MREMKEKKRKILRNFAKKLAAAKHGGQENAKFFFRAARISRKKMCHVNCDMKFFAKS